MIRVPFWGRGANPLQSEFRSFFPEWTEQRRGRWAGRERSVGLAGGSGPGARGARRPRGPCGDAAGLPRARAPPHLSRHSLALRPLGALDPGFWEAPQFEDTWRTKGSCRVGTLGCGHTPGALAASSLVVRRGQQGHTTPARPHPHCPPAPAPAVTTPPAAKCRCPHPPAVLVSGEPEGEAAAGLCCRPVPSTSAAPGWPVRGGAPAAKGSRGRAGDEEVLEGTAPSRLRGAWRPSPTCPCPAPWPGHRPAPPAAPGTATSQHVPTFSHSEGLPVCVTCTVKLSLCISVAASQLRAPPGRWAEPAPGCLCPRQ